MGHADLCYRDALLPAARRSADAGRTAGSRIGGGSLRSRAQGAPVRTAESEEVCWELTQDETKRLTKTAKAGAADFFSFLVMGEPPVRWSKLLLRCFILYKLRAERKRWVSISKIDTRRRRDPSWSNLGRGIGMSTSDSYGHVACPTCPALFTLVQYGSPWHRKPENSTISPAAKYSRNGEYNMCLFIL
jgi:hypothetical protein